MQKHMEMFSSITHHLPAAGGLGTAPQGAHSAFRASQGDPQGSSCQHPGSQPMATRGPSQCHRLWSALQLPSDPAWVHVVADLDLHGLEVAQCSVLGTVARSLPASTGDSEEQSWHARSCFPEANNLTKSGLISIRNVPALPNFKSLFQSMEAPEVLKQRDGKKKNSIGKATVFPQPSAET